ncbi:PREDICTED: uncharacterized protein LOC106099446 [Papilio polytes]|uniref:uncharacterized protein LOC106099446 n=1 Tax=Papilio polytes TaxID=76194 RepID=UPI00067618E3|nr:PREDICTED: uncharacterized protein LOC106099446 [Papilio polytes]
MHHLALQYIKSFPENDELNDVKFDCLAYLGDWSEIVDTIELEEKTKQPLWNPDVVIKSLRYACLKESLNADPNQNYLARLEVSLNRAKLDSSKLCRILNMDNCQSVYKVVANLHLLRDIQDYCSLRRGHTDLAELLNRWQVDKLPSFKNFKHLETLLSQRSLILENAAKHYESFSKDIVDLQLQYVEMGLTNQRVQMAQRLVESVKKISVTKKVRLVESQVAWAKGHKDIALATLHGALIVLYMNSAVFEKKVKCIDSLKGTAASLKQAHTRLTIDEKKTLLTTNRFMEFEEAEVSNTRAEKNSFLNLALRYYMLSLKQCEDNNLSIFRVISLWFDNPEFEFSDSGDSFRDLLNTIPSWKYNEI